MGTIINIPSSERAHARDALREHLESDADLEGWLRRWVGTFESLDAYVHSELEEIIAPRDQWLAGYVDTSALARDWADCCRVVYGHDRRGRVHVFAWLDLHAMDPAEKRDERAEQD